MMLRQARELFPINHSDDASPKKCFALVISLNRKYYIGQAVRLRNETEGLKKTLSEKLKISKGPQF